MQKVRYCLSSNSLNTKFQALFNQPQLDGLFTHLFTFCSHYSALSISDPKTLEIDFPIFNRRSSFYGLLENSHQTRWWIVKANSYNTRGRLNNVSVRLTVNKNDSAKKFSVPVCGNSRFRYEYEYTPPKL